MNEKSLKAINEAKVLMLEMKHEAEKYSKLFELSRKNFLEEIQNNVPAKYDMYLDLIKQSWKNFHEGRKDCYDYLAEKLSNDLGIENIKINFSLISCPSIFSAIIMIFKFKTMPMATY